MPESKGRRRGQHKPTRTRRRSGATTLGVSHVSTRLGEPGRRRIRPRTWRKIRRWGFITAAAVIAVVVIGSFALQGFPAGIGGGGGASQAVAKVGTPVANEGSNHVEVGQTVEYRTTPPTSGNHWSSPGLSPAKCGIYDEEVADERIVHNMEHGHVIISYNLPDSEDKRRLLELADDLRNLNAWGIVRPYSKIDQGTVAMTAWGVIDQVEGVDENRIKEFYDTYIHNRLSGEASRVRPVPCTS